MAFPQRSILLAIICCLALPAAAATWQPARIGEHETSLPKRIKFPDWDADVGVAVRCEAKILPAGTIDELGCYDEKADPAFLRAVMLAGNGATVEPATVDGENVNVLMLFSVLFQQKDGKRAIMIVPNHGTNKQELGWTYSAPQRYGRSNTYVPRTELGLLWIDAEMSAAGKPRKVQYLETEFSNKETERYAKSYVKDGQFIPGHHEGEPRTMRFVKPIFGYRNGFMWENDTSRCRDSAIACDETSGATGRPRYVFDD